METTSEFPRVTRLLDRGAWNKPKHKVERGTPSILNAFTQKDPSRLDLAYWATDEAPFNGKGADEPNLAVHFRRRHRSNSRGLGTRTPRPEYIDLLDWLAVDFRENGWSQKSLIKTILTSKTYQQDSSVSAGLKEFDPNNRLLARGSCFRTEAEVLRDIALSASGLLTEQIGGPSVFPPVPESVIKYNYVVPDYWYPAEDENRYRRSLYMFRKRSMPDPV